jgi:hypothetical protein
MIIYESRPTVEAGGIAFKSEIKFLLKVEKKNLYYQFKNCGIVASGFNSK